MWITRASVFSSSSSSYSRPTKGAATETTRPSVSSSWTSRHAIKGSPKPFSSTGPTSSVSTAPIVSLRANGPIRISPGCATLLQARRDVDGLAGGEGRVALVGDDLARLDADPGLEPEAVHRVEDRGGGADGALGVVLVRLRDAEGGHDGVAGELLHDPAVRRDAVRDVLEERVDAAADDLGIARSDELGRADEVDEEHGRELAFHRTSVGIRLQAAAARKTEADRRQPRLATRIPASSRSSP